MSAPAGLYRLGGLLNGFELFIEVDERRGNLVSCAGVAEEIKTARTMFEGMLRCASCKTWEQVEETEAKLRRADARYAEVCETLAGYLGRVQGLEEELREARARRHAAERSIADDARSALAETIAKRAESYINAQTWASQEARAECAAMARAIAGFARAEGRRGYAH